jgi:sulfate adenylyltransferase subunit 2
MNLNDLESQSIDILRETREAFTKTALLWSIGKDSTVLLHLTRKAFFGHVPFPLLHIDTSFKIPEMIRYRDRLAKEWELDLIVGQNEDALKEGMQPEKGRLACCQSLKTEALAQVVEEQNFQALILGIRHDEEASRSKEKIFSPRQSDFSWNFKEQPPQFWEQYNCEFPPETHVRVHPLLNWREIDIWRYILQEDIEVIDLYFSKNGRRYRSLGCAPCTKTISSPARNIADIIRELENMEASERAGRSQDAAGDYALQLLREKGYM